MKKFKKMKWLAWQGSVLVRIIRKYITNSLDLPLQEIRFIYQYLHILGWTNKTCRGGDNIFKNNETHLISLLGDTQENCKALCDALSECNLVEFHSGSYRKFYKCIPKSNFNGKCNMYSPSRSSIFSQQFYVKPNTGKFDITVNLS